MYAYFIVLHLVIFYFVVSRLFPNFTKLVEAVFAFVGETIFLVFFYSLCVLFAIFGLFILIGFFVLPITPFMLTYYHFQDLKLEKIRRSSISSTRLEEHHSETIPF